MPRKCDIRLNWWIALANLYQQELPAVADPISDNRGFAERARKLKGPRPRAVEILLNPGEGFRDRLIAWGDDADKCLWAVAGVAKSVLSNLAQLAAGGTLPKELIVADWSKFTAPLILSVASSGQIIEAERPEPLTTDLLVLLREKNVRALGACPVCRKLFERLRSDQQCDSRRCRDTYRQRRFRAEKQA